MNKNQLIAKLNDIEWEDFEVKEAQSEIPKISWETESAFSNTSGGWKTYTGHALEFEQGQDFMKATFYFKKKEAKKGKKALLNKRFSVEIV